MKCWLDALHENAVAHPERVVLIEKAQKTTYGELYSLIKKFAAVLSDNGLKKGEFLLCRASQTRSFFVAYCAALLCGGIFVPAPKDGTFDGISEIFNRLEDCRIVIGSGEDSKLSAKFIAIDEVILFAESADEREFALPEAETDAMIIFTTGTTGTSKGVYVTNEIFSQGYNVAAAMAYDENSVIYIISPVNHYSFFIVASSAICVGGAFVISQGLSDYRDFAMSVNECGADAIHTTPSALKLLFLRCKELFQQKGHSFRTVSIVGEKCTGAIQAELKDMLPQSKLIIFYGSTEAGSVTAYDFHVYPPLDDCVGYVYDDTEVLIETDDGKLTKAENISGRVVVKTPYRLKCYYNDPESTDKVLRDGYIYTDDRGYLANGKVFILGRISSVITSGGYKIDPGEVENTAVKFDQVSECVCVGVKDKMLGEKVKLIIVPAKGRKADETALMLYLGKTLESHKLPKIIEQVDELKRNTVGKIDRRTYEER